MSHLMKSLGLAAIPALLTALPVRAQEAASLAPYAYEKAVDKGDISWMTISTVLVLLMTVPGLALFYGGLVRTKNMLSVLTQVFAITCVVAIIWITYGYSLAFTYGGSMDSYIGGFSKVFLAGVDPTTLVPTFSNGVWLPEYSFIAFQMTFACITPALIVGAFAERVKFSALLVFVVLWVTFIYFPMAHMVWWWGGPDFLAEQQTLLLMAEAAGDTAAAEAAAANISANGMLWNWGALDFAGGTVVHINAGVAGLVGAMVIGKRVGFMKDAMTPHSLTMTMIGASLLWVGWFGFNAGSNLEANGAAALAFVNTLIATAAATLSWVLGEWMGKGKPSMLGAASGAVAGLVAITPACGFVGPMGGLIIGLVAGVVCLWGVNGLKRMLGADDSLDVFGVHGVGGILGAILTGVFAAPSLGGIGFPDWVTMQTAEYSIGTQVWTQIKAVVVAVVWSGVVAYISYKLVDMIVGLRVAEDEEREGLDIASHGESAYHH